MCAFEKKQYIAFTIDDEEKSYVFAVPIENIDALVPLTREISYTIPPRANHHVLCVMNPYGKLVTVINLLGLFNTSFMPETANIIIVFNFLNKVIGIPAQSAHSVTAYLYELTDDKATGTQIFVNEGTLYHALDIPRLYNFLENAN